MVLQRVRQAFCAMFGLLSLLVTLYALVKFILFTSKPKQQQQQGKLSQETKVAVRYLVHNAIWLVVFILQHSLQKHENVKKLWAKIGLATIERSAYNLLSSLILLVRLFALPGRCFMVINQISLNVKISFTAIGAKLDVRWQMDAVEHLSPGLLAHLVDFYHLAFSFVEHHCLRQPFNGFARDLRHQTNLLWHSRLERTFLVQGSKPPSLPLKRSSSILRRLLSDFLDHQFNEASENIKMSSVIY